MKTILSRRSIRKYTDQPVSEQVVQELLEAAMSAPSAGNQQSWHFIVINDRQVLDEIPKVHPHSQMLKEASVAILVCGDLQLEKHKGFLGSGLFSSHRKHSHSRSGQKTGCCLVGRLPQRRESFWIKKTPGYPGSRHTPLPHPYRLPGGRETTVREV